MLKILQARLQQYVNCELPDVQAGFRKGRGTRDQVANICWIIKRAREFQNSIYFCPIDYAKAFDCVNTVNKAEIDVFLELSCFFHDPADESPQTQGLTELSHQKSCHTKHVVGPETENQPA